MEKGLLQKQNSAAALRFCLVIAGLMADALNLRKEQRGLVAQCLKLRRALLFKARDVVPLDEPGGKDEARQQEYNGRHDEAARDAPPGFGVQDAVARHLEQHQHEDRSQTDEVGIERKQIECAKEVMELPRGSIPNSV